MELTPVAGPAQAAPVAHGTRKLKGIDVPVYVDGAPRGVLRFGDLPDIANVGSEFAPRFRLSEYLEAIGVKTETVKSIYFLDVAQRVGSIEGAELVKDKPRFVFRFTSGTTGGAETSWDTTGLKNLFVVHEIRSVNVFVKKDAPKIGKHACLLDGAGECTEKIPYVDEPLGKGTRLYMDGRLVGIVKRRSLDESLAVGGDEDERVYGLTRFARSLGVETARVKKVELRSGDEVIGRASGPAWTAVAESLAFTAARHQHGLLRMRVPADLQAKGSAADREALATSIHLFSKTGGTERGLVPISEATDMSAELAAGGDGSGDDSNRKKDRSL